MVYISFKENGNVDRYSLWTPQKKDIKPVIERDTKNGKEIGDTSGVIGKNAKIISEKGCQDEEFKRCVASFEKAFDKERKAEAKNEKRKGNLNENNIRRTHFRCKEKRKYNGRTAGSY